MKRSYDRGKAPQRDDATLSNYVKYHRLSHRKVGRKWMNGAFVENEIIAAVAHQNDIVITIAQCTTAGLHVFTPNAEHMDFVDEDAQASPFFLWCTGGHYQAFVKVSDFEILATALELPAFKSSRLLNASHFHMN
jgi:hypothetical protein